MFIILLNLMQFSIYLILRRKETEKGRNQDPGFSAKVDIDIVKLNDSYSTPFPFKLLKVLGAFFRFL